MAMLHCILLSLLFCFELLASPTFATPKRTDGWQDLTADDQSKHPYKHFGQHYEYAYEIPLALDQKPKFMFSYGIINPSSSTKRTIWRMEGMKTHKPKKYQSMFPGGGRLHDVAEPKQYQESHSKYSGTESDYVTNSPPRNINTEHIQNAWKESEEARKRAQVEYEAVRQLADDIFGQAEAQLSEFPAFDIPRFQKVFSAVTAASTTAPADSWVSGNNPDRFVPTNRGDENFARRFQEQPMRLQSRKPNHRSRHHRTGSTALSRNTWKSREYTTEQWNPDGTLKQPERDSSYRMFGLLPKFDPRFPFDRAYKLLEGLQPPKVFNFPAASDFL